jgi:hypothetical protein
MKKHLLFVAGCLLGLGGFVHADTVAVVNFDNLPQGPSLFGGPAQTITPVPGVATFSGGQILGDASNFPAIIFATAPNVYGTDNGGSLLNTLTIAVDPSFTADEISFVLFNGENTTESYVVDAFSGATLVASQALSNLSPNTSSGFGLVDLFGTDITSVTIATTGLPASWDFLIDSVAFNESINQEVAPTPEPSSFLLLGTGLTCAAGELYRRARRAV